MALYVTVDIGGTAIKHGVLDDTCQFLEVGQSDTNAHLGGESVLATVQNIVRKYKENHSIEGICISTTGIIDIDSGSIEHAGPHMPGYAGMRLKERMENEFSVPCEVENDVNCAGLAEAVLGAGKGSSPCLCVTVGTKIGGCLVLNGEVYHGFSGSACEVGYLHMQDGKWEDIASTSALVERVNSYKNKTLDGRSIFALAKDGDPVCVREIEKTARDLARGLADLVYVLNPQVIILGGGIMNDSDYLRPLLEKYLQSYVLPKIYENTTLAFAQSGNHAGMLGAHQHFLSMQKKRQLA